jgi:hypothetical protein
MIERATCLSIRKEGALMAMHSSTADQLVSPTQVWRHLSTDLQVHVIRLLAQLAAHLVLTETESETEEEHAHHPRKETCDALSAVTQQDPA